MSDCTNKEIGKELDRYILDLLSDRDTELFEQHLLECPFCAAELENFSEASRYLLYSKTIKAEVENMILTAEVQDESKSDQLPAAGSYPWWKRRIIWAAAALFLILLFRPWKIVISPINEAIAEENRIAVMPINSPEAGEEWLGTAVTSLLATNLSESNRLTILTTEHIDNIIEYLDIQKIKVSGADLALRVAEKAGANWVIMGNVSRADPKLSINIILLNTSSGDTVANMHLTGKAAFDLFSIIDKITDTLKTDILQDRDMTRGLEHSIADITTRSPEAYRYYLKAVSFYDQLYAEEAESCFVKAISYDSTFAMAYYYLAKIKGAGHIENALKYINRSSRREQYYIRGLAFLLNRDNDGFFNEIEKLIRDFPLDARAYYWYAQVQNSLRSRQKALDYFHHTVEIDPYYKLAYNEMSYIFMNLGNYEKALWANDMYMAISPDEANPYDSRGDIYADMGEFDKAIESYLIAVRIKHRFNYTYSKLGVMYQLIRDFDQARYWENQGWSNEHTSPFPADVTANMLAAEGKFEKAIETLDTGLVLVLQGIMKHVSVVTIIQTKALILAEKDPLSAVREMEEKSKLIDSLPENLKSNYYYTYTRLLAKAGAFQRADSSLRELKQELDTSAFSQYRYYLTTGYIDLQRQRYGDAISHLRHAGELVSAKDDFDGRYLLAIAFIETGHFEESIAELTRQLKSPNFRRTMAPIWNAKMHYYLGRAYEGLKKYQLASEQYEYFLEIWKDADWKINEIDDARVRLAGLRS